MRLATVRRLDRARAEPSVALQVDEDFLVLDGLKRAAQVEGALAEALGAGGTGRFGTDEQILRLLAHRESLKGVRALADASGTRSDESKAGDNGLVRLPADQVRLLLPFHPVSLRDFLVWEGHYLAASRTMIRRYLPRPVAWLVRGLEALGSRRVLKPKRHWYRAPIYYKGNPRSFVGPEEQIAWPAGVRDLDFELEIGFVLRHSVRDATPEQAESAIAAYTIFNDFTARDLQIAEMRSGMGPAKSKDFDTGNAMGPVLVTADEIADVGRLRCRVLVNGEEWISTTTQGMRWHPAEMIAYASRNETLYPGDFFATGTVAGCSGVELDRWLKPGDLLELDVECLGTLRNRIGPKPG